jgi:6-phosphogluconolactonase
LTLDRTGRFLLVANYGGSIVALPVAKDGSLSAPASRADPLGKGSHPRQDGSHPHGVYLDRTNSRLLVPDLGLDRILVYRFDASRGSLQPENPFGADLSLRAGPRHLAWSSDGRHVYAVNELDSTVTAFDWDSKRGRLARRGTVSTRANDLEGENYTAEIALHPNGRFLYASNRGDDSLAVFAVDKSTGALKRVALAPAGGRRPRHFVIAPSGRWLLVAHQASDTIAVFRVDLATGQIEPSGELLTISRPASLLFLPSAGDRR